MGSLRIVISAMLLFCGIIQASPQQYEPQDGWRMMQTALPVALRGSTVALHDCFMASYLRASSPFQGGEDCEAIVSGLSELLFRIGDREFSKALALERPEIIAAVHYWIANSPGYYSKEGYTKLRYENYPRTQRLLAATADSDFPKNSQSQRHTRLLKQLLR